MPQDTFISENVFSEPVMRRLCAEDESVEKPSKLSTNSLKKRARELTAETLDLRKKLALKKELIIELQEELEELKSELQ